MAPNDDKTPGPETAVPLAGELPTVVAEEEALLRVVLAKLDAPARRAPAYVDDTGRLIELRDALAEAKPDDQGSLLEQMHRTEALMRQRGKGQNAPADRKSPYFGHLRLDEDDRRRDVLIGARGYVEPGGGVQIVDWRNAPVSRLFYRYEEGDFYEEKFGDRVAEGQIVARRMVSIVDAELRRVQTPQGTFVRDPKSGQWRELQRKPPKLRVARDGTATLDESGAPPPATVPSTPGKLGLDASGGRRVDRHLPSIAALIDPRQFELITRPTSGLIAVQGSAGSGKTTIGLHRIAYLAFVDPGRFRPERMLVVVYQRALAAYVDRVLPDLQVPGVPVVTFTAWAEEVRRATVPTLSARQTDATPSLVVRAKTHRAMLKILADRQAALAAWCRSLLETVVADVESMQPALVAWDASTGPCDQRVTTLAHWVKQAPLEPAARNAVEGAGRRMRERTRDVIGEWAALLTDRGALGNGFARHAPGEFSEEQMDSIHRWCVERDRLRTAGSDDNGDGEHWAIDAEDDALLLRIHQLQKGPISGRRGPLAYEHLMVDEVQDFAPLELAVLLDTTTPQRSVTLAGDTAQSIAEYGFRDWSALLDDLGISHSRIEPLRVSYRSTREIVDLAEHVLGPLSGDVRPVAPRAGAPVEAFGFGSPGEAAEFLAQALKELVREEPAASVALIARHPEQARLYGEALAEAEVPSLRLVADQDFTFTAGVDVTDVRQTKGLEFDIAILLEAGEASYPATDEARRLLHVAMTRAANQLWITYTGSPSPLLPPALR